MLEMKKMGLNGKMVEVVPLSTYASNPDAYVQANTGIELEGFVLPLIGRFDQTPGIYVGSTFSYVNFPSQEEEANYSTKSDKFVDMSNVQDVTQLMEKQEAVRNIEREILTTPDNIYVCKRNPNDSPAMTGLKDSVDSKGMDISKYAPRFGSNYNNDRRKLEDENVSISMIERFGNKFDMKVTIRYENANPNVPNPMKEPVEVVITGGVEEND